MNTDLAKQWLFRQAKNPDVTADRWMETNVLAFAKYLDEREEGMRYCSGCRCEHSGTCYPPGPRKEDKPVCEGDVFTCPDGFNCTHAKPKPEPIEELSGGVVYADARDEVSKKIAEQMARKIIELRNKLNEVIRRLNTLTK